MSAQYDGSIIIDTEMDSEGFMAGSKELLEAVKSLVTEVKALGTMLSDVFSQTYAPNVNTSYAEDRIAALEAQTQELQAIIDELNNSKVGVDTQPQSQQPTVPNINLGGTTQKASDLQKQIDAVNTCVERLEPTFQKAMSGSGSAMASFEGKASALENKIAKLQSRLDAVGQKKIPTEDYTWLQDKLAKCNKELDRYYERENRMRSTGVKEKSSAWRNLQYDIQAAKTQIAECNAEMQMMQSNGTAFTLGVDTSEYQLMSETLAAANERLQNMRAGTQQSESFMRRLASAAKTAAKNIGSAAKKAGGKLLSGIKSAGKSMLKLVSGSKSASKQFSGLISGAKKFALSMLGARGVYALLRKAVSAYMQENEDLQKKLDACWSGIGNLLGPIITKIINLVAQATAYVTAFLKLFGVFGNKANKAAGKSKKAADNMKKSLLSIDELNVLGDKSSSDDKNDASSSLPDVQLPDWAKQMVDQIQAGDWEGAAKTLTSKINKTISSVKWKQLGSNLGKKLNGLLSFFATSIKNVDWKGIGKSLGDFLTGLLNDVDWGNLGVILVAKLTILLSLLTGFFETLDGATVSKSIYDFIYGIINATDWVSLTGELSANLSKFIQDIDFLGIGQALSDGVRTFLQSIDAAIINFDWGGLGTKIADLINGIDWGGILTDLISIVGNLIVGLLSGLTTLLEEIDWDELGHDVYDAVEALVCDVDWGQIISLVFELLGAALGGATALIFALCTDLWDALVDGLKDAKTYFDTYIEEAGGDIIEGIFEGIKNALVDIGTWIKDNIFTPFMNGFRKAFDMHSPSKKMEKEGPNIVDGLRNGIKGAWGRITSIFNDAKIWGKDLCQNMANGISQAKGNVENAVRSVASKIKAVLGFSEPDEGPLSDFHTYMPDMIDLMVYGIKQNEKKAIGAVKGVASAISSEIQNGEYDVNGKINIAALSSKLDSITDRLGEKFADMLNRLQSIADSVTFRMPTMAQAIPYKVSTTVTNPKSTSPYDKDSLLDDIYEGVYEANQEQNALLREQNYLLKAILDKDSDGGQGMSIDDVVDEFRRMNRKFGKPIVPVGG